MHCFIFESISSVLGVLINESEIKASSLIQKSKPQNTEKQEKQENPKRIKNRRNNEFISL